MAKSEEATRRDRLKNITYLTIHPKDSQWDYTIDLRIHLRAASAEHAVERAEKMCALVSNKVPWCWVVVKRFGKQAESERNDIAK